MTSTETDAHGAQDSWLDQADHEAPSPEHATRTSRVLSFIEGPVARVRRALSFLGTTPGTMVGVVVLLTVAIFAAGYSMSQSTAQRQDELDVLLTSTEPLSYSSHQLYSSLSEADTLATSGFVQPGVDSTTDLENYHVALDRAAIAATATAQGLPEEDAYLLHLIAMVNRQLPVYAGLVETARSHNRVGNSVGMTYMANASALMREEILPAAAELFQQTSTRVGQEQRHLSTPQWVPLSGLVAALFFLVLAQIWLARKTRRRFNRGFLVATAVMVLGLGWASISNFATWQAGARSVEQASQPWELLTSSRIQAQQARTSETLALVRRESVDHTTQEFEAMQESVSAALDAYQHAPGADQEVIDHARRALGDWEYAHSQFTTALQQGNYDYALYLSTESEEHADPGATSAGAYRTLDQALNKLNTDARESMRLYIGTGLAATNLVSTAVLLLSLVAIVGVWLGIRPRLQEYF